MLRSVLVVLVVIASDLVRSGICTNEINFKCPYEYSVDLTHLTPYANGSYRYEDIVIPSDLVYTFTYTENGTQTLKNDKIRGCICSIKRCLRVCSSHLKTFYFNNTDKNDISEGYTKTISLNDGSPLKVHLIDDFHLILKNVCDKEYPLDKERISTDGWTLFEVNENEGLSLLLQWLVYIYTDYTNIEL